MVLVAGLVNVVKARLEQCDCLRRGPVERRHGGATDRNRREPGVPSVRRIEEDWPVRASVRGVEPQACRETSKPQPAEVDITGIRYLTGSRVREDGWALWAWFATPSAWLGGRIPSELLGTDPQLVAESARQRAAAAA